MGSRPGSRLPARAASLDLPTASLDLAAGEINFASATWTVPRLQMRQTLSKLCGVLGVPTREVLITR
jgi:hypothetical protein